MTVRSPDGTEQVIVTTAEHPAYVQDHGWVKAGTLKAGDELNGPDGTSTVVSCRSEIYPQGVDVFNFRVNDSHTYFVRAEGSTAEPIWVHNSYDSRELRRNLIEAGETPAGDAAHVVPSSDGWSRRPQHVQDAVSETQGFLEDVGIEINDADNGFFSTRADHWGTHTNKYLLEMHTRIQRYAGNHDAIYMELDNLKFDALNGKWL